MYSQHEKHGEHPQQLNYINIHLTEFLFRKSISKVSHSLLNPSIDKTLSEIPGMECSPFAIPSLEFAQESGVDHLNNRLKMQKLAL